MVMMMIIIIIIIIITIINYLKDSFINSTLVEAHIMQYLILYHVLYSINVGFLEMDKQIRWETKI
jgi:hypothetical protein